MTPLFTDLTNDSTALTLCAYVNTTGQIQIARIADTPDWYFERVVFPGQRLMFEAPIAAHLEIYSGTPVSALLSDTIACQDLQVGE
ncbi:MAG TPA: DUF1830 domain-containing protein [Microcoleaceae cyanobacterium]|jgi:hypothetical protein